MSSITIRAQSIGSNQLEIQHGDNRFLVSYNTPVAAYLSGLGFYRTTTKFSRTTSKHINKWIGAANANTIDQKALEDMLGWNV